MTIRWTRLGLRVNGGNRPRPSSSSSGPEGRYGERQEKQTHRLSPPEDEDEHDAETIHFSRVAQFVISVFSCLAPMPMRRVGSLATTAGSRPKWSATSWTGLEASQALREISW